MARILNIESSTTMCSVSIGLDGDCIDFIELDEGYSHAEKLALFASDLLERNKLSTSDLDAVAISKGPGSYTGLRIGVSLAKGLCFGANLPLISVSTLQAMCLHPELDADRALLCPMLDARRMEVYTAEYDSDAHEIRAPHALVLDETSFTHLDTNKSVVFFGNGSAKFQDVCTLPDARFVADVMPSAQYMTALSEQAFQAGKFEDVAYFEPFYLKEFYTQPPKK